jgi:hypothetical protein
MSYTIKGLERKIIFKINSYDFDAMVHQYLGDLIKSEKLIHMNSFLMKNAAMMMLNHSMLKTYLKITKNILTISIRISKIGNKESFIGVLILFLNSWF